MTNEAYKDELNAAAERGAAKRAKLNMHAPGRQGLSPSPLHAMLDERGSRYGKFVDHARVTQAMKAIVYDELRRGDKRLMPDQIEALDMIVHKIGRIVCGNPDYEDSWRDIAGYATLVADRLKGEER